MNIKWTKYIPHTPTPRQLAFLSLTQKEAFFGGAAGGGKSDALLMGALQYADTPGYKALIIRRSIADMLLPSSILSRAKEWLKPYIDSGEVKYRPGQNHTFTFPSGAEIACGYLENAGTEKRYQGSEYTYIAFDELTHFQEAEYVYLFSRLRKALDSVIPSRVRSASNPGGVGMKWVKDRFKIYLDARGNWVGGNPDAPFIPSKYTDNPHINSEDYAESLGMLGTVAREQLREGNWDINEEAIYDPKWFEDRYTVKSSNGNYLLLNKNGLRYFEPNDLMVFTTIDCAASVKTGVKNKSYHKTKKTSSWSVCATWGVTPQYDLLWLDNVRLKTSIPNFVERIIENQKQWKPLFNIIEKNGPGEGVYQFCEKKGLPMDPIHTRPEKIVNSVAAQLAAEQGKIWLPKFAPWLKDLEDELFLWTGDPLEEDDQIDVLSNAANKRMYEAVGYEKSWGLRNGANRAKPFSSGSLITHRVKDSYAPMFMGYSPLR